MKPTELYIWFAENKATERDGELFIRAWTADADRVSNLQIAIGRAPEKFSVAHPDHSGDGGDAVEVAIALEQQRALSIVQAVREQGFAKSGSAIPTQAESAFDLACEEIEHRLRTEVRELNGVSAPVPQDADERARFEVDLLAYFAEKQPDRTLTLEDIKGWRGSRDDYAERPVVRGMWEGWQRCVALASNKAAAVAAPEEDAMDTLVAVLDAIGYTEEFAESHPSLKVSEGVKLFLADKAAAVAVGFDMLAHLQRQREWSERTFGPGSRAKGVVDHIRKELSEIEADPTDLTEWIDVVILALDGAWRAGGSPQQIIDTIVAKQTKNEGRVWPDWRTMPADKAIEHSRAYDAPAPIASVEEAAAWLCMPRFVDGFTQLEFDTAHLSDENWVKTPLYTHPAAAQPSRVEVLTDAARDVLAERQRQITKKGHTVDDDAIYNDQGQMSYAAAGLAVLASEAATDIVCGLTGDLTYADECIGKPEPWPHDWKYKPATPRRNLVVAAAFILAEIERIDYVTVAP